jgi:hypothetical protein
MEQMEHGHGSGGVAANSHADGGMQRWSLPGRLSGPFITWPLTVAIVSGARGARCRGAVPDD